MMMTALPAGHVLQVTLVFLECGCSGIRGVAPPDAGVLIVIQRPCNSHAYKGKGHSRYVDAWELVSPFAKFGRP